MHLGKLGSRPRQHPAPSANGPARIPRDLGYQVQSTKGPAARTPPQTQRTQCPQRQPSQQPPEKDRQTHHKTMQAPKSPPARTRRRAKREPSSPAPHAHKHAPKRPHALTLPPAAPLMYIPQTYESGLNFYPPALSIFLHIPYWKKCTSQNCLTLAPAQRRENQKVLTRLSCFRLRYVSFHKHASNTSSGAYYGL